MPKVDDAERTRARGGQVGHETATLSMDEEQRSSLEQLSTATLSSQLRKQGVDHHVISGLAAAVPEKKLVGVARTLRYLPLREDVFARIGNGYNAQKRAVDELSEGQVLVIDSRGVGDAGTIGDLLVKAAMVRGAAGVVTDGGVRDFDAITELGFPVYFAGPHPAVLGRRHVPADTGLPIACGGALVMPGDFIVGDGDGVIVIPRELADEVIGAAHQQDFEENYIAARIADGDGLDGLYPMDRETRQAFETWAAKSGEKLDGRSSAHGG
jgi:regulator of RNase E activity RraA